MALFIGGEHGDLCLPDNAHIRSRCGIEGIEQTVQFLGHEDERILLAAAAGKGREGAAHEHAAERDACNAHCLSAFFHKRFLRFILDFLCVMPLLVWVLRERS